MVPNQDDVAPQRTLAMSGDIFHCRSWVGGVCATVIWGGGGGGNAAAQPPTPRTAPTTVVPPQMSLVPRLRTPDPERTGVLFEVGSGKASREGHLSRKPGRRRTSVGRGDRCRGEAGTQRTPKVRQEFHLSATVPGGSQQDHEISH